MKKDSEILREARKLIESGGKWYICVAIAAIVGQRQNKLITWISDMLGRHTHVRAWLHFEAGVPLNQLGNNEAMRLYRLRWLDRLIEICEREGA